MQSMRVNGLVVFFFFKQKTAYEMRISDWSSDVCSSDLRPWDGKPCRRPVWRKGRRGRHCATLHSLAASASMLKALAGPRAPGKKKAPNRSEERRVGKECVSTCRSRWSPYH